MTAGEADNNEQEDCTDNSVGDVYLVEFGLELDPGLVDKACDAEEYQLSDITVCIDHHALRVHENLPVHVIYVVRLESHIDEENPADNESGEQEPLFLFGVRVEVLKNLEGRKNEKATFGKSHQHVLRRVDAQVVARKSGQENARDADKCCKTHALPEVRREASVNGGRRGGVSAREGISARRGDGIPCGENSRVADPGAVGADGQLEGCVEGGRERPCRKREKPHALADAPVHECGDDA